MKKYFDKESEKKIIFSSYNFDMGNVGLNGGSFLLDMILECRVADRESRMSLVCPAAELFGYRNHECKKTHRYSAIMVYLDFYI